MSEGGLLSWAIAAATVGGVIVRPWRLPEALWAVAGAALLLATGGVSTAAALAAVARGQDVYLFLAGMLLLSELARREGLFDWLAAHAARSARGSPARLFALVYGVGVAVTALLSNDATAVVLTPAVAAIARAARADPLPYLLACAFTANAASFVLPISNPANLVLFGERLPPLGQWLATFALPSLLSVAVTYLVLRHDQRARLAAPIAADVSVPPLGPGGGLAAVGVALAGGVLLAASAAGRPLGAPTCAAAALAIVAVSWRTRRSPRPLLAGVSWGVLPLVAGLFVVVAALESAGAVRALAAPLAHAAQAAPVAAALAAGVLVALACNLMNNLPAGLLAASTLAASQPPTLVTAAVLIGVDLGPNLSVTGSLATVLWLAALRREGLSVGAGAFLRIGARVMPPALAAALAGLLVGWLG